MACWTATLKTINLPKKPTVRGTPANEAIPIVIEKARNGDLVLKPFKESRFSLSDETLIIVIIKKQSIDMIKYPAR